MILPITDPDRDIPAPDTYTNPEVMARIMDTYSNFKGYTVPGIVTGKPVEIGGAEYLLLAEEWLLQQEREQKCLEYE